MYKSVDHVPELVDYLDSLSEQIVGKLFVTFVVDGNVDGTTEAIKQYTKVNRTWDCKMHSQVPVNGEIYEISKYDAFMVHEDYSSVGQFIERTLLRYSAAESEERKVDIRFMQIFTQPLKKFLGKYFIRKGYKDGTHGFIIALLLSIYEILIILQVWDKKRRESK
jgi:hypothetical protein